MPDFSQGGWFDAVIVSECLPDYVVKYEGMERMLAFGSELYKSTELVKALL